MIRNYLLTALRNLARNRLYAAINMMGLSVGFAAALLIVLFVHDDFNYDTWIPNHEQVYEVNLIVTEPGRQRNELGTTNVFTAAHLQTAFPEVEAARMEKSTMGLRHGDIEGYEAIAFADPQIFSVLPLPFFAGNVTTALSRPDSVVMTRRMARKYFGKDDALGQTLEVDRQHAVQVSAILEDLPSNTHLNVEVFIAGSAPYSRMARTEVMEPERAEGQTFVYTYVRLMPNAKIADIEARIPEFQNRHFPNPNGQSNTLVRFVPLREIHLTPAVISQKPTGSRETNYAILAIAGLILIAASINFVNLMTARASRRAVEVGVRKAAGAVRHHLAVQFIGETLIYVTLAMLLAGLASAILLPRLGAFLQRDIGLGPWNWLFVVGGMGGAALSLSIFAGLYPALILSSFRPAVVLKSNLIRTSGSARIRQALVVIQFAILTGLCLATGVIYHQSSYAIREGLRLKSDQIILVQGDLERVLVGREAVSESFRNKVRDLPGVSGVAASLDTPINSGSSNMAVMGPDGTRRSLRFDIVEPGLFELYGLKPRAGRFFDSTRAADAASSAEGISNVPIVLNETAVRRLGFASPEAAIGQSVRWSRITDFKSFSFTQVLPSEIIGVVPDFGLDSVRREIEAAFFYVDPKAALKFSVKLNGERIPETLEAIDRLWNAGDSSRPIKRQFVDQLTQEQYLDVTRQSQILTAFASVAIFIACIGLLGLAAFAAESRTKEIGVRKAMGANTGEILGLLIWQFVKPVLLANCISWPVAYLAMQRWLEGFAYHIDLRPWMFLAASALALLIAILTVIGHALLVARAQPVAALRYE